MQLRARYGANILGLVPGKVITMPGPMLEDAKGKEIWTQEADGRSDGTSDHANRTGMKLFQCKLGIVLQNWFDFGPNGSENLKYERCMDY